MNITLPLNYQSILLLTLNCQDIILCLRIIRFYNTIFGSIGMDCVVSEQCYKGIISQRHHRKMTILWSIFWVHFMVFFGGPFFGHFPMIPLSNSMVKKSGSQIMTM